ncbi:MAG: PIG-L family deacetylase [Tildeniella nuda ZEHNDER 1965/U140]|jgi:LmbE family N-acetylglucosaminyl deacetylase|nr:PIG-L family deacetylase [Tildeniella nuda ZEHNDER 1965/U140]
MNAPIASQPPLFNPATLPLRSVHTITGSALVVAPHPDDETLGCGGAIALLRALDYPVYILVISDGTLSHPRSLKYPAPRLQALRQAETLEALSILGVEKTDVMFLGLQDGSIPTSESPGIQEAVACCRTYLEALLPETIFLPWRTDPHPDHRATWKLMHTALVYLNYSPRIIEYPIWDWDPEQGTFTSLEQVVAWRLDIQAVLETKLRAIAAYRSQTTNLIDDDPEGFQLTPEMLVNFTRPWEMYLEDVQ